VKRTTEVIAHRGFSAAAPENTMAAFEAAIACGADRLEFDVLLTRDGVPVVIHDETVDRTTDGHGPVASHALADLERLDAGSWFDPRFRGERIPTLDAVLDLCQRRIALNVEIKAEAVSSDPGSGRGGIEEQVAAALARRGLEAAATVSSFAPQALRRLRELGPGLIRETLWSSARPPEAADLQTVAGEGSRALNLAREELWPRPELVAAAHAQGLQIKVYTVDDAREMQALLDLEVDGIFTNRPDLLLELRRKRGQG
jgi:glycerophosphoryl diester phosphodiesterase